MLQPSIYKSSIFVVVTLLFLIISFSAKSQCDVSITAQGATTFCEGDSVVLVASGNGSSLTLDQSQTLYNGGTSARNLPGYSYWQSFVAGVSGTLVQIDAGFFTYINGTGYWTVWEGSGTSGAMLDSQALNISCSGGNCLLSFTEDIPITAGETYTFQIRGGPGMPDPYGLQIGAGNPYTNGVMGFVDPSGTYLTEFDWVFNTYVASGGVTYLWSNGETDSAIVVNTSGEFSVNVSGASGCTDSAEVEITVNALPEVSIGVKVDTVCLSDATVLLLGDPYGGIFSGPGVSYNHFTPPAAGVFTVYYTYTDVTGCSNTDSINIVVEVCTGADLSVYASKKENCRIINDQLILTIGENLAGAKFKLVNCMGENILEERLFQNESTFDISQYAPGIYCYEITGNNQRIVTGKLWIGR
ncbi:MAG: T9SS type A sorting domain-containing protein [Chitinophagales bacterium]